jgi:hypothetical protein
MKLIVGLAFFILLFGIPAYAAMSPFPIPVCDHNPDSLAGFGEVKVWGLYISCDNIADGVCPEDYQDSSTSLNADCSSCTDPDCTGNITGYALDASGSPVDGALISSMPIRHNQSAPSLETYTSSLVGGYYMLTAPTGTYSFRATKDSYDTVSQQMTITRNGISFLNFTMLNGTCHDDCTDSYGNCKASCNGLSFGGGKTCNFDPAVISACDNRSKGTEAFISGYDATHSYFADCCEGSPVLKYYAKASTDTSKITDLIQIEKVANLNGDPVKVIVAVFNIKG